MPLFVVVITVVDDDLAVEDYWIRHAKVNQANAVGYNGADNMAVNATSSDEGASSVYHKAPQGRILPWNKEAYQPTSKQTCTTTTLSRLFSKSNSAS